MKNTKLEKCAFINEPGGKAIIEDLESDSPVSNAGLFIGERIKILLKRNWPILSIISTILGIIGIILKLAWNK